MFNRLFRPRHKPRSTREMIRVLRAAAQFSDQFDQRTEYEQAADALERVIEASERHSDAPTRDAFAYALGRAELDLGDKLTELIEVVKDTHVNVQDVQSTVREQGAVVVELRAEFHDGVQALGERVSNNEGRIEGLETRAGQLEQKVAAHDDSRDQSIQERKMLREDMDESKAHRARIQTQLDGLTNAVQRIEQLLEVANDQHEANG